ncbi:hypothetical protein LTS18_011323, partial [Coniosporium uncinatum]
EGNKTFVCGEDGVEIRGTGERVNWRKFEIMGEVIVGVQRAQGVGSSSSAASAYREGRVSEEVRGLVLDVRISKDDE